MRNRRNFASHSHANECPRCGEDMENTRDMVKIKTRSGWDSGVWVHRWCASGGDE